jgi:hypothetical protein
VRQVLLAGMHNGQPRRPHVRRTIVSPASHRYGLRTATHCHLPADESELYLRIIRALGKTGLKDEQRHPITQLPRRYGRYVCVLGVRPFYWSFSLDVDYSPLDEFGMSPTLSTGAAEGKSALWPLWL